MKILGLNCSYKSIVHDPSACLMINGKSVSAIEEEDLQNEFWKLYFKYAGIEKIKNIVPRISPTFLRQNLDFLN